MRRYAILGATGNTGGSLLQILTTRDDIATHCLVRSRSKLLTQNPSLSTAHGVEIFEGAIDNASALQSCITGVSAIFLAVAVSDNVPGCSIATDTAEALVAAFERIRHLRPDTKLPRVIVLSSASISDTMSRDLPHVLHTLMLTVASNVYADLRRAEQYLRVQADVLGFDVTFMKPGGLVHDKQRGHRLSETGQYTFMSFLDLAGEMMEVADDDDEEGVGVGGRGRWHGAEVGVVPLVSGQGAAFQWGIVVEVVRGLLFHFFPWMYEWLK